MTRSEVLFKSIDFLLHLPQNYKRFPDITVEKDIVYDENYPYIAKGDVYYSKKNADEKFPVILNIHGGGYVAGDKKHRKSISSYYADKGWFVYNINYRLSPSNPFPSANTDCINALNYLVEMEEKYNLDLDRVVVTGDSAGAYLAAYLVSVMTDDELRTSMKFPEIKIKIAGLMGFCGPYDFLLALKSKIPFGFTWDIGKSFLSDELAKDLSNALEYPYIKEASPINYINKDWCPTFLVYAKKDLFCKGQGELLKRMLKELQVPVFSHHSKKLMDNHCYHLDMYKRISKECFVEVEKYLDLIKGGFKK